jgi:hypothetical protein
MINYTTMSFKHKPKITTTYDRKIRNLSTGSASTTTTTTQSIPFNDESFNNHHLVNSSSQKVETNNWARSIDGLDLDNITSSRLRTRRPSMKVLMSQGGSNRETSLLGKRPPPRSSSSSEDITESYSRLSVNDEADLLHPPKRRDTGSKGKISVIKNQASNLDVFDFPDDDDNKPTRRFNNKTHTKTYDKSVRGLSKISAKNKDEEKSTQGFFKIPLQRDEIEKSKSLIESSLGNDINEMDTTLNNNLSNNVSVTSGKNKAPDNSKNSKSDDVRVMRGMNKISTKDNKDNKKSSSLDIFDFPDSDNEVEKNVTRRKSIVSFTVSESSKKVSKNLMDSSRIIDQNSFSNVSTSSRANSSSTRISRFLTTKTSKSASSTNNRHSDSRKNGSSNDRKSVDVGDVFDFVKFIRGEAKTKRNIRSQPKSGSNEPITGIVNDRTNNMLNNRPITSTKKNSQTSLSKSLKKPRKTNMLIDIPQAPSRPITEVGTPVSFLSFQQKKKPNESSVWDVVDAVTSPTDVILSPRKQNLVAKMSKPATSAKQEKSQPLSNPSTWNYSSFSITKSNLNVETSKSQTFDTKTKDNEILSYAGELLASSESVFDFPSSAPSSYNIPSGSGQKTYGQGRTILGQDLDSMSLDPIASSQTSFDMELDDDSVIDDNPVCKIYHYLYLTTSIVFNPHLLDT